mmetsp:Transcript_43341/g.41747  ORF Transcript_43341/g.41747 Transcript_43341/m.41747 type:complete len:130 (-) Transcript_43341:37-426(-)
MEFDLIVVTHTLLDQAYILEVRRDLNIRVLIAIPLIKEARVWVNMIILAVRVLWTGQFYHPLGCLFPQQLEPSYILTAIRIGGLALLLIKLVIDGFLQEDGQLLLLLRVKVTVLSLETPIIRSNLRNLI